MEIREVKERKMRMEGELIEKIEDFERDTGLRVDSLYLSVISETIDGHRRINVDSTVLI